MRNRNLIFVKNIIIYSYFCLVMLLGQLAYGGCEEAAIRLQDAVETPYAKGARLAAERLVDLHPNAEFIGLGATPDMVVAHLNSIGANTESIPLSGLSDWVSDYVNSNGGSRASAENVLSSKAELKNYIGQVLKKNDLTGNTFVVLDVASTGTSLNVAKGALEGMGASVQTVDLGKLTPKTEWDAAGYRIFAFDQYKSGVKIKETSASYGRVYEKKPVTDIVPVSPSNDFTPDYSLPAKTSDPDVSGQELTTETWFNEIAHIIDLAGVSDEWPVNAPADDSSLEIYDSDEESDTFGTTNIDDYGFD